MNRLTVYLLIVALLGACSTSDQQPQWIDNAAVDYPAEKYLTAIGEADNRETAAGRARANLAQIFQVAIKDNQQDFSQAIVNNSQGQSTSDNQLRVARFVNTQAQQVLEGTDIVSYWESPEGKVFSLALLDKAAASRRFRESIRDADRKTRELIEYASNQAPNPVAALRALEEARLSQLERDNSHRNLMVTAGKGINSPYSSDEVTALIRNALSTLQFAISADDSQIQSELGNAAASLGVQLVPASVYQLSSTLDTEPLQQKQGWWWIRGSLELELRQAEATLAKQRWPIKQSSMEAGMAQQRLRDTVNKKLPSYLYQMLTATPVNQ
ncbi:LPP20 family lipoprotein [Oceanicoccus sagamiensis]|uniref:Lipoprotein LPP20-like domain-containing protein n=1 Tax=Oceanicoccus sagamiensis TaxID=716816 RepID=A0A1X9N851_9GAMM|nr:LPP20 family lipoprotein [Oceanicoccus sagamiensis]ARN74248.1 hypothetical protein BST96_09025 [Oceanicoccus sagamiensis]